MKQITQKRKKELEEILGHNICPLVAERIGKLGYGIFERPESVQLFYCSVDNKRARGGLPHDQMPGVAKTPCSEEFVRNCPLYERYVRERYM